MQLTSLAFLGPIGGGEIVLISLLVLLLFGAKKLPEFAKGAGKALGEFRKAKKEFADELQGADEVAREIREVSGDIPKLRSPAGARGLRRAKIAARNTDATMTCS